MYRAFLSALLLVAAGFGQPLQAQTSDAVSSRNGYWMPNRDTLRIFLVFAEIVDDPVDPTRESPSQGWPAGRMPPNADTYFDHALPPGRTPKGWITRFFHEGSFGQYVVLGDYYPELIRIPAAQRKGNGDGNVLEYLNALPGEDLRTAHGYTLNGIDFDRWTAADGKGLPKTKAPDGLVDFCMIVWRINSRVSTSENGGSVNVNIKRTPLKGKQGFMDFSRFVARHSSAMQILKHEFSHSLYGGNNFHTGSRGAGNATFMHAMGGYSNLSSFGANSPSLNAWDRHRMGWKPKNKSFFISATCASTGQEVSTDLAYRDSTVCPGMRFWLDDFSQSGDALRIQLPYVQSHNPAARNQYLWFENHQRRPGRIDHEAPMPRGIYAFAQIGKDDTSSFGGPGLYTVPLHGLGHFDLIMDPVSERVSIKRGLANPFTGLHLNVIPAVNRIEPNIKINGRGDTAYVRRRVIQREETLYLKGVQAFGGEMPASDFVYSNHPVLGTAYDGFGVGRTFAVGENPAPTPWLTWEQPGVNEVAPYAAPQPDDNRHIPLNGIVVKVLETDARGRVLLDVSWQGQPVEGRQRWCGPLYLREPLRLADRTSLELDLGLMPTRPVDPLKHNGQAVFSDTTVLRLLPGSRMELGDKADISLLNGSRLIVDSGATLVLGKKARIRVRQEGLLDLRPGSRLALGRKAKLEEKGGTVRVRCDEAPQKVRAAGGGPGPQGQLEGPQTGGSAVDEPDAPATPPRTGGLPDPIRVVSANIRYANPDDGPDAWSERGADLAALLQAASPDILGVQEALVDQVRDLDRLMPGYAHAGAGREDGRLAGEWCAIFYDRFRFDLVSERAFWLSETPEQPSTGWDAALPRIATVLRLEDKASGQRFWVANTHFDHRGAQAREASARLLVDTLLALAGDQPLILMGDFNATPDQAPIRILTGAFDDARRAMRQPEGPEGTFWGFDPETPALERIDYLFAHQLSVRRQAHLDALRPNGRHPSDHLPVLAEFGWPGRR